MGSVVAPSTDASNATRPLRRLLSWTVAAAWKLWGHTTIGHHGQYSLERLYAFDEYCRSTSCARVAVVCCATPLLPLLLVLGLELIPLQPPSHGWKENYALFLRAFFSAFVVAHSVSMQARNILPGLALSLVKCAAVATATAVGYVAVLLLLAWLWVFPVPFSVALCSVPFTGLFMLFGAMAVGRAPLQSDLTLWPRLRQFVTITCVQVGLTLIYPAYNAVFIRLSSLEQAGFVLLLPALKTTVKYVLAQHVVHIEDYLPEIAVVSVEVFHALYLSTSMQNTGNSLLVSGVIVTLDALHLVLSQTLQLLFTCEYLVLSEYIECMVPTFYLVYLATVRQLPNAEFYPQIHDMSTAKVHATLSFLALYAALELLSLVVLHVLLHRKFRLPPLHLLAFVLETQREMIVGKLIAWSLIILQLPLVHFGLDFSFQFAWIKRSE